VIQNLASQEQLSPRGGEDRQALDTAVGILVGLRRCSTRAAFHELIGASERHRVPVFSMASALVSVVSRGADSGNAADTAAQLAAEREWGENYWL
jgi:AmiR/NasT family two-component response regulator